VHLGAHADAPSHYHEGGASIDEVALDPYLGPCEVVSVQKPPCGLIEAVDCAGVIARGARRVLFRTGSAPDPTRFNTDFVAFAAEAIEALGKAGVVLVGIDTPSVDPFSSKDLPAHQALFRWKMRNLEGLVLEQVVEGRYELVALPLKLVGFDASPVRAVLVAPS
jgi:arylformamidase